MDRTSRALAALLSAVTAAVLLSGCPNVATLTTASNIGEGTFELTAAPGVSGISWAFLDVADFDDDGTGDAGDVESGYFMVPTIDLAARYGLTDNLELGFGSRNWFSMLQFDLKATLVENESMALALKPAFGVGWGVYWTAELPLLVDFKLDDRVTLSLAAKYSPFFVNTSTDEVDSVQHFVGGNVAVEFKVSEGFYLMPNFGLMTWLNADDQFDSAPGDEDFQTLLFSGGVALKFRM